MTAEARAERNRISTLEAWCIGCGLHWLVSRRHRSDCTAKPLVDSK